MNTGSIDNPATYEARLFAFLLDHIGRDFTSGELSRVLDGTPCAHNYVAGLRLQLDAQPERGYRVPYKRWEKSKGRRGAYVFRLERRVEVEIPKRIRPRPAKRVVRRVVRAEESRMVHAVGQMELAGVGG